LPDRIEFSDAAGGLFDRYTDAISNDTARSRCDLRDKRADSSARAAPSPIVRKVSGGHMMSCINPVRMSGLGKRKVVI